MNTVNTAAKRLLLVIFICGLYVLLMNGESASALYGEREAKNVYIEDYMYLGDEYTSSSIDYSIVKFSEMYYYDAEDFTWSCDSDNVKISYNNDGSFDILALNTGEVIVRGIHNNPAQSWLNGSTIELKLSIYDIPAPTIRKQTDLKYCNLDSDSIEVGIDIPKELKLYYDVLLYRSTKKKGGYKLVKRKFFEYDIIDKEDLFIKDKGLKPNTKYYYKICIEIENEEGKTFHSALSKPKSYWTACAPIPKKNIKLNKSAGHLSWSKVKGADGYIYDVKTDYPLGRNIWGAVVYKNCHEINYTTSNSVSKKLEGHNISGFNKVYPYTKHGKYYYVYDNFVSKKLSSFKYKDGGRWVDW